MFERPELADCWPPPLDTDEALSVDECRLHRAVGGQKSTRDELVDDLMDELRDDLVDAGRHVIFGSGLCPVSMAQCMF